LTICKINSIFIDMDLSIVFPVYNEAKKIQHDIKVASDFLVYSGLIGEIIIVDDGSTDSTSLIAIQSNVPDPVSLKIVRYEFHRGKGYAVRMGISDSKGKYVMFMDSGGNVPLSYIHDGLALLMKSQCDIAIGSRRLPESKINRQLVWYRRLTSLLFRKLSKIYLNIPASLTDTQCGFKFYKGDVARELYADSVVDGFTFDLEIILRARNSNYSILEFPIEWSCDRDSRLSILSSGKIFNELNMIKKLLL
jgi:dolichyl-phosphate beta-glucosyltransferase